MLKRPDDEGGGDGSTEGPQGGWTGEGDRENYLELDDGAIYVPPRPAPLWTDGRENPEGTGSKGKGSWNTVVSGDES